MITNSDSVSLGGNKALFEHAYIGGKKKSKKAGKMKKQTQKQKKKRKHKATKKSRNTKTCMFCKKKKCKGLFCFL
jgi:hypothetical protein